MTKPKILITGNVSPFVMRILLERYMNDGVEFAVDRPEVDVSDYDMIAEGCNCLPVISEEQISDLRDQFKQGNLSVCPDWICDSITLLDEKPEAQKVSTYKTKTIAKHNYPWYHRRSFR